MSEEKRFDLELTGQLAEFDMSALPEEEQVLTSPWQHLANKLVWGVIFSTITLNFLYLDLILPAVGIIWLVQALRPLRRENGWLRLCGGLAWVLCAARLISFTMKGTLLPESDLYAALELPVGLAVAAVWLAFYFTLWRGLLAVGRRAGQEQPSASGVVMLMVWYGALMALALSGVQQVGWFAFGLMLLLYFLILRSVWKTVQFLEETGYVLQPLQLRISDRALTWLWLGIVAAAIALALTFGTRYPMDWQPRPADEQTGYEEMAENLRALGLPEEMVVDLAAEDLAALAGADKIVWSGNGTDRFETDDGGKLAFRTAAIRLPHQGSGDRWAILHYFVWEEMPPFRGTEALQLWAAYRESDGVLPDETLAPRLRLLYDGPSGLMTASPRMETVAGANDIFGLFGSEDEQVAAWSLPRGEGQVRGYVLYGARRTGEGEMIDFANCYHAMRKNYPFVSARQDCARGLWSDYVSFARMQNYAWFRYGELNQP